MFLPAISLERAEAAGQGFEVSTSRSQDIQPPTTTIVWQVGPYSGTSTGMLTQLIHYPSVDTLSMSVNATEVTCSLHWLPIRQRIQFKIGLLGFKARHCIAASVSAIYCLQPSSDQAVDIKPAVNSNFSSRAFSVSVPTVWNSLKPNLRFVYSSASFRSQPKTTPFHSAYGNSLYSLAWLRACIQPF